MSKITSATYYTEKFSKGEDFLLDIIKEAQQQAIEATLELASEKVLIKVYDGHFKTNSPSSYVQINSNNIQIDKKSILNLKHSDELKV